VRPNCFLENRVRAFRGAHAFRFSPPFCQPLPTSSLPYLSTRTRFTLPWCERLTGHSKTTPKTKGVPCPLLTQSLSPLFSPLHPLPPKLPRPRIENYDFLLRSDTPAIAPSKLSPPSRRRLRALPLSGTPLSTFPEVTRGKVRRYGLSPAKSLNFHSPF